MTRFLEEFAARVQFQFKGTYQNSPILRLQNETSPPPWSSGVLLPRLTLNPIWRRYVKWADAKEIDSARRAKDAELKGYANVPAISRPHISCFIPIDRESWLMTECTGSLCKSVLPCCRPRPGHLDFILSTKNTKFIRLALRWRRGVLGVLATCPACNKPFRTSHVARCKLLGNVDVSHMKEDLLFHKKSLPDCYSVIDAALNNQLTSGFMDLIERLCILLKISVRDA